MATAKSKSAACTRWTGPDDTTSPTASTTSTPNTNTFRASIAILPIVLLTPNRPCLDPSNVPSSTRPILVSLTNAVNHPIKFTKSSVGVVNWRSAPGSLSLRMHTHFDELGLHASPRSVFH